MSSATDKYNKILGDIEETRTLLGAAVARLNRLPQKQQGRLQALRNKIGEANSALTNAANRARGGLTIVATQEEAANLATAAVQAKREADAAKGTKEEGKKKQAAAQAKQKAEAMAKTASGLASGVSTIKSSLSIAVSKVEAANQAALNTRLGDPTRIELEVLNEARQKTARAAGKIRPCPGRI